MQGERERAGAGSRAAFTARLAVSRRPNGSGLARSLSTGGRARPGRSIAASKQFQSEKCWRVSERGSRARLGSACTKGQARGGRAISKVLALGRPPPSASIRYKFQVFFPLFAGGGAGRISATPAHQTGASLAQASAIQKIFAAPKRLQTKRRGAVSNA